MDQVKCCNMVLIHTTLGRGTLKLGIKFYSLGNILQYWLETGGKKGISLGKIKQLMILNINIAVLHLQQYHYFYWGGRDKRETTSPESLEKISHSVSSLKAFLNGNCTLLYILSVNNLINNKTMRKRDVFFRFYWSCMRNMFGLSFYKMILQACSKAHYSLSFGVKSRIMQSRNKTTTFLKPLMKIFFFIAALP